MEQTKNETKIENKTESKPENKTAPGNDKPKKELSLIHISEPTRPY